MPARPVGIPFGVDTVWIERQSISPIDLGSLWIDLKTSFLADREPSFPLVVCHHGLPPWDEFMVHVLAADARGNTSGPTGPRADGRHNRKDQTGRTRRRSAETHHP